MDNEVVFGIVLLCTFVVVFWIIYCVSRYCKAAHTANAHLVSSLFYINFTIFYLDTLTNLFPKIHNTFHLFH